MYACSLTNINYKVLVRNKNIFLLNIFNGILRILYVIKFLFNARVIV